MSTDRMSYSLIKMRISDAQRSRDATSRHYGTTRNQISNMVKRTLMGLQLATYAILYPIWFHNMPYKHGTVFAVGYAPIYFDTSASFTEAKKNLKQNLCLAKYCEVAGERAFLRIGTLTAYMGGNITLKYDTACMTNYYVLDSAITADMVLVLGSDKRVDDWQNCILRMGDFWHNSIELDNFITDVVAVPLYYYESSSWQEGEKLARVKLATQLYTKIKALQKVHNDIIECVSVESTSVKLMNTQILGRYKDESKGICYLLVGLHVNTK